MGRLDRLRADDESRKLPDAEVRRLALVSLQHGREIRSRPRRRVPQSRLLRALGYGGAVLFAIAVLWVLAIVLGVHASAYQ